MTTQITISDVRRELYKRGLTMRSFGGKHGFKEGTVVVSIWKHIGKDTTPRGRITKQILSKLHEELGFQDC